MRWGQKVRAAGRVAGQSMGLPVPRPPLLADDFAAALVSAGVIPADAFVRRVIIDIQAGHVVIIHVEKEADPRLLDIVLGLDGAEIRTSS